MATNAMRRYSSSGSSLTQQVRRRWMSSGISSSSGTKAGRHHWVAAASSLSPPQWNRSASSFAVSGRMTTPLVGRSVIARRTFASYPPHQIVGLPSLSPTMDSGSIASWNLKEGDSFAPGDIFCSVETDKAVVDFESQDEGVLAKILVPAGGAKEIKVGQPIMVTVDDAKHVAAFRDFTLDGGAPAPPKEEAAAAPAAPTPAAAAAPSTPAATSSPNGGRIVASPLAYQVAKEMGYDLRSIPGTGPGGRIVAADVRAFVPQAVAAAPTQAAAPAAPTQVAAATAETPKAAKPSSPPKVVREPVAGTDYTDYPLSESAQEAAARLVQAKRNIPHYYLTVDIACDRLLAMREKLNASITKQSGGKDPAASLGVYEFFIKAAAASMKTVPVANASWMEDVIRVYHAVDLNVVLGAGDSLYTPVLRNVQAKGLQAIANELNAAMQVVEQDGDRSASGVGTFTVINLGMYGIHSCAPIIREPQACALALGALEHRIVPADETSGSGSSSDSDGESTLYQQSVMVTATLSCDHRVVDGAVGAQWLAAFKQHVENPETLLL